MSRPAALQTVPHSPALPYHSLRDMVLNAVTSPNSRKAYGVALEELRAFCVERNVPFTRETVLAYRAHLLDRGLAPASVNLKLSAVRRLAREAERAGYLPPDKGEGVNNVRQGGHRMGQWLTVAQARALLALPDRETVKGKRDAALLALLLGCALRREEAATLKIEHIQEREGRPVIADLVGKGRRVRTIAIPAWVMIEVRAWMSVLGQSKGPLMRGVNKGGVIGHDPLGPWAVWDTVKLYAKQIGLGSLSAHDLRRTCAKLCRKNGGELEQIQFLLGHQSIQTTERYLGSSQELQRAVNDNLGI